MEKKHAKQALYATYIGAGTVWREDFNSAPSLRALLTAPSRFLRTAFGAIISPASPLSKPAHPTLSIFFHLKLNSPWRSLNARRVSVNLTSSCAPGRHPFREPVAATPDSPTTASETPTPTRRIGDVTLILNHWQRSAW
jgi:hypothetical protein